MEIINLAEMTTERRTAVLAGYLDGRAVAVVTAESAFNGVISSLRDGIVGVRYAILDDELHALSLITRKVLVENVTALVVL